MTFFDHQEEAKRRSRRALFGFMLTVMLTVVAVSLFGGYAGMMLVESDGNASGESFWPLARISGFICLGIIFISWAWRASALSAGPDAVMRSMGGTRLAPDSEDPDERRLLNLVEEMSIASGVPVPDTYLLESGAVNACAVGMKVDKAAVAVTRGAVQKLSRDELQGVVAHEFSHILHGDMSLNTHMIAWLAGLFTISEIGRFVMNFAAMTSSTRGFRSRGSRDEGGGRIVLLLIGGGIWCLGSIGIFFGKLLQSAVSRQREFLADASAIQYTRNPDGLGNALRKLGKNSLRGRMLRPNTDCAHMMFANLRSRNFVNLFATHPPLDHRIRRVLPHWDGNYLQVVDVDVSEPPPLPDKGRASGAHSLHQVLPAFTVLLNQQGWPDTVRLQAVEAWKAGLAPELVEAARDPLRARQVVFALLLVRRDDRENQVLTREESAECVREVEALLNAQEIRDEDRLGLLDLCLPALRRLDPDQQAAFMDTVGALSGADERMDLFEYCLGKILAHNFESRNGNPGYGRMRVHIPKLEREINVILSLLSRLGAETEADAERSFQKAREWMLGYTGNVDLRLLSSGECGLDALDAACDKLPGLAPQFQERLLLAGLAAIAADDDLQPLELQAYRALAAALHIPVPPGLGIA
ncbi:MAG: M48 family metalloprotease [Kiritimatiellia bacterium]